MKRTLLAFAAVAALVAPEARAQNCGTVMIPNFRRMQPFGNVMSLAWDHPDPTRPLTYEVVQHTKSDYCTTNLDPEQVVGTTSATSFTFTMTPNKVAVVHVRKAGDACFNSQYVVGDAFTSPPSKPNPPTVTPAGAISVNYSDGHAQFITFQRFNADGSLTPVGSVNACAPDPKTATDSVTPGAYRYRAMATNAAGFTPSDFVNVTIGNAVPLQIVSFTATPTTIANGNPSSVATLTWVTHGADTVTITPFPGTVNFSGSITAKPVTTTTYTLTAKQNAQSVTATVTVNVLSLPFLNITKFMEPIIQLAGTGGGTSTYALTNVGGTSTTVTLSQSDQVTQTPATFNLDAGATQPITLKASAQPEGFVSVPLTISYTTGPNLSGIHTTIQILSTKTPQGLVSAEPQQLRVDVQGEAGTNPAGTVTFTNHGTAQLSGVLSADVEWIVPQSGTVTIPPGQSGTFNFSIDRSKRPDASAPLGSLAGHLKLSFLKGSGSGFAKGVLTTTPAETVLSVTLVKVVDTVQGSVTPAGVPALGANEVALFVAGVGHTTSSNGTVFVSDVSLLNAQGSRPVDNVKLFYTSVASTAAASKTTALPAVPGQANVSVADVVKTVFSGNNDIGTLHIRSKDADKLAVAASVLATNSASGTIGNAIPILRSDRSVASGGALVINGLRKDATSHTDLYVQETAGLPASIQIDFLAADGSTVLSRPAEAVDAFRLRQLKDIVPANAVAAVITSGGSGGGKIAAYATPVDETSGDSWAVADWPTQLGYAPSEPLIIPIAGSVHGFNGTFYRSDVAITNRGTSAASATMTFIARDGTRLDRPISLGGHQTAVIGDVVGTKFGITSDTMGYVLVTPSAGSSLVVTSRAFATVGAKIATYSSGVPALAASSAVRQGSAQPIAGLSDAAPTTVLDAKAGTFRTNFALMETTGNTATVRVTFRFTFPAGDKVQGSGAASRDYVVGPNVFLFLDSIASEILGGPRLQYGDLQNVAADFQVIDGDGAVILFTSTVDNASGDSILRTQ